MKSIGVIGTAKNTGKTTTLAYLLDGFKSKGLKICVTGIGYDGEEIDNITNLPKPRLYFEADTILATSEKCLDNTVAEFDVLEEPKFSTSLGKILIVKITKPGKVVIAGPNRVTWLREIIGYVKEKNNIDILLVDGSLNRISPMYILDKLVFTTGASRSINLSQLVQEMTLIEKIFSYPIAADEFNGDDNIRIIYDGIIINLYTNTLVDDDDFLTLECSLNQRVEKIFIPGLLSIESLTKHLPGILKKINKPFKFVFNSPVQLLLSEDISKISAFINFCDINNVIVLFKRMPQLAAVTINPFYPKFDNYNYIPSYLDKEKFYFEMSRALKTPVFNIMENGADRIFKLL